MVDRDDDGLGVKLGKAVIEQEVVYGRQIWQAKVRCFFFCPLSLKRVAAGKATA